MKKIVKIYLISLTVQKTKVEGTVIGFFLLTTMTMTTNKQTKKDTNSQTTNSNKSSRIEQVLNNNGEKLGTFLYVGRNANGAALSEILWCCSKL